MRDRQNITKLYDIPTKALEIFEVPNATNENMPLASDFYEIGRQKPKLLLHSCCGPCSTAVIERLMDDYDITVFFYNPNITDSEEYQIRKATQLDFIKKYNLNNIYGEKVSYLEGEYDTDAFYKIAKGLESEPEGGSRCELCEKLRLERTAAKAKERGFPIFATTLTVSPHKNYDVITMLGRKLADEYGIEYLDKDFKKKAGFQRSIELSKDYKLYRQNYCGCEYSKR